MREGYKQSPIGEIPKEWNTSILGNVSNIKMGQSPSSSSYNDEAIGSYLIQGNADIKNRKSKPRQWTSEPTKYCNIGDILMTVRAPVGAIAKSKHKACIGRGVCSIWTNEMNLEFLYQYLLSYENSWKKIEQGSTFTAVNGSDIRSVKLPFPPLPEQQKIAEILSTVDGKIEIINQQITETQQLKKGMMQRLLTKGVDHTEFKDSPLGEIPKSWEVVEVQKISKVIDSLHKTPIFADNGYPMVRVGDINKDKLNLEKCLKVSKEVFEDFSNNHLPKSGDILMTRVGSYGKSLLVDADKPFCIGQNTVVITEIREPEFLFQIFNSFKIQRQFDLLTNGSSQPSLSLKNIRHLKVPFPPIKEQQKIADILSTVDNKLEVLADKKAAYQQLKKGLMQQLLTGKVRVKV